MPALLPLRSRSLAGALLLASVLLASVLLATPAAAYVRASDGSGRPLRWHATRLQLEVATPPGELGRALLQASERAAARWSAATGLSISVRSAAATPARVSEDGRSLVVLRRQRWCPDDALAPCHDPSRHALTQLYTRPAAVAPAAEIIEADIELNGVDFTWSASAAGALDAVLLHELGHLLGLDHSCAASRLRARTDHTGAPVPLCSEAPASALRAVMYPDPLDPRHGGRRELSEDELRAGTELYGGRPAGPLRRWSVLAVLGLGAMSALWLIRNARRPSPPHG